MCALLNNIGISPTDLPPLSSLRSLSLVVCTPIGPDTRAVVRATICYTLPGNHNMYVPTLLLPARVMSLFLLRAVLLLPFASFSHAT